MSMNSKEKKPLYNILLEIKDELVEYDNVLEKGLDKKLDRTSNNYKDAVNKNCRYILSRSSYKSIMAIDRYEKRKEKNETEDNYGFIETY